MNLKSILFLSLSLLLLSACGDDEEDTQKHEEPELTQEDFCADWYSMEKSGLSATSLLMTKSYSLQRTIYANPKTENSVLDYADGKWVFYPENSVLRLDAFSKTTGYSEVEDYKVLSLGKYEMTLRSVELGLVQNFHKVLGAISSTAGTEVNLSELDFFEGINAKSFVSYNTEIAQVSKDGIVSVVGSGETYIEVATEDGAFVVKVLSVNNVEIHVSEIGQNFNDVVVRYGEPSKVADLGNGIIGNLFNDPSVEPFVSRLQINYDAETFEVTRVMVVYRNQEGWSKDSDFIENNYIFSDWEYYCDAPEFLQSSFFILPFEQDGKYYITYGNTAYSLNHGGEF